MKIYLVRHGETTGDVEDKYGGDYDDHLSGEGLRQSEDLAKKLESKGIQIIYSSPKLRALETAKILGKKLKVNIIIVQDLMERNNYGILTGLTKNEAKSKYPAEVAKLSKDNIHHNVKGSESYAHFKQRVLKEFDELLLSKEYDTIAVVTHGGPIKCIGREVLKIGEFKTLGDCAVLTLEKNKTLKLISLDNAVLDN